MNPISWPQDRPLDLIAIGRLCIDMNANEINRPMEETLTFTKYLGGSPANIVVAAARLGLKTGFIGKVSSDQFGNYIRNYLIKEGIDTGNVVIDRTGAVTGLAFTEIKSPEDCSILMYRDNVADLKLEPNDVKEEYIRQSKAILISGTALSKSPSREAVFMALEYALKHNVLVFFDVDYRPYSWNSPEETGIYCRLVAEKSDVIIAGREEFDLMEAPFGELRHDDWYTAETWLRHKAKLVMVKHGSNGSIAFTNDGKTFRSGTYPTKVVKTFGAGDSFAGAFIYGLFQGWSVDRCQKFGSASASIVVASHSCSDAMPTAEQIQAVIDRNEN